MQPTESNTAKLNQTLTLGGTIAAGKWSRWWRESRRWPIIPVFILLVLVVMAIFAPLIAPHSPTKSIILERRSPPVWDEGGTRKYILGADLQGRDILSRIIHGSRVSLILAFSAISISTVFGTAFGLVSGYFGGLIDEIMMRIVDIFLAIPLIMFAFLIVLIFGQSFTTIIGILVLFSWVPFARQVRAETHQLKTLDYVAYAHVAGASAPRILLRHIFPGVVSTMTVIASLHVGSLILTESILSYLGAGIPPPTPAWGAMVSEGRSYLGSSWWIAFFPGVAIFFTVLAFNFLGDWLRDYLDPRLRQVAV